VAATAKPVPPIDVALSVRPQTVLANSEFAVELRATFRDGVPAARAELGGAGVVTFIGEKGARWPNVAPGGVQVLTGRARVDGTGHGEINGSVAVDGAPAGTGSGRTAVVYVYSAGDEVLLGTDGPSTLELTHLDHELAKGRISHQDYEQRRDAIVGGG
jgi:hypothetical protein